MKQLPTDIRPAPRVAPPEFQPGTTDLPKMEVPAAFRELADKGVAQARDNYEKAKAAVEDATARLKDTYTTAAKGATDYNLKVFDVARTNTNTAIDYARELLGVKSLSELSRCQPHRRASSSRR